MVVAGGDGAWAAEVVIGEKPGFAEKTWFREEEGESDGCGGGG